MPANPQIPVTVALLTALLLSGVAQPPAHAQTERLDAGLREAVHHLPVAGTDAAIVVTSYRPPGEGPFPWIVLSHGTATTIQASRQIGRWRNLPLTRQWVNRGYAVLVPIRRGYGASGGPHLGDSYGSCRRPDFIRAGEGGAADLLATIEWARTQHDLAPDRWMLVGQSAGGFASIYTASKQPAGLRAVLAFAPGRGGRPDTHPGEPCAPREVAALFARVAPAIKVPVLWFYAENDEFIGPAAQRLWFDAFRTAGGRGELVTIPPFPHRRGHGVLPASEGVPLWTPVVRAFLATQRVGLTFE